MDIEAECTHTSNTNILREYHDEDRYLRSLKSEVLAPPSYDEATLPPAERADSAPAAELAPVEAVAEAEPAPPRLAKRLLLLLTPAKANEYVLGDLEELFRQYRKDEGAWFAYIWYWEQVLLSAWPMIRMFIGGGVRIGLAAWLGSWAGRWIDLTKLGAWLRRLIEEWLGRIIR